ncbi:HPF/RaiA family ribosome-associated protein [Allorhodopirellula solitaria]|uniref:Sigma 54 modulation protein / S30EA ribosomal protein n=1 Tax=Allorhodopirellula solitaria TaxID=2527987 RepID=A0A5C5YKH8_9BACT|nr:HPF/RaiA family ribosome-associated protein [Allorhodopirellula solitaria]TWT75376.1 Sigma 54 modulation protein / S30EA ribosomal protein [Allorhodopirellula solitaria]
MQIQTHTDNHIQGGEALYAHVQESVEHALERYERRITRVEVFLAEEHAHDKHVGHNEDFDKRCVMEARLRGLKPISVRHHSTTVRDAFEGAADKLRHLVEKTIGRLEQRHANGSVEIEPIV